MVHALVGFVVALQTPYPTRPPFSLRLDTYRQMLRNMPRPERRLRQEEADRFIGPDITRMYSAIPPFSATELNRLSTLPTEELAAKAVSRPESSPWETYELFVRKDPAAVPKLLQAANLGNEGAVLALGRISGASAASAIVSLAQGTDSESKAVAGVLLGIAADRRGVAGMRLAVTRFPQWVSRDTATRLMEWGDRKDAALLRSYYRKGVWNPPISLLREYGTKECLAVLFELPSKRYRLLETVQEISQVNDPRVRPAMRKALLDREGRVRAVAADWFTLRGDRSDLPALKHALAHPPVYANGVRNSKDHWTGPVKNAINAIEQRK